MNTQIFSISKEQVMKAVGHLLVGIGFAVLTFVDTYLPGFWQTAVANPLILGVILAINTSLVAALKAYLTDEQGKLGGMF
jgi:hypothetical protein